MSQDSVSRIIGIRHRVKKTKKGEARPTQICIFTPSSGKTDSLELEDDTAERDFALGVLPVAWQPITESDNPNDFPVHNLVWTKVKNPDDLPVFSKTQDGQLKKGYFRKDGKQLYFASKIPTAYEGLRDGDTVAMMLGGSGDTFAYALANRSRKLVNSKAFRVPPFIIKKRREKTKDDDAIVLAQLFVSEPDLFYEVRERDRRLIKLRIALQDRIDVMKARIACEQRLRQRFNGATFTEELVPGKTIEDEFLAKKANDVILSEVLKEELSVEKKLKQACMDLDVFEQLFVPIEGVDYKIASRIIANVIDIRRFPTAAKFCKFCGAFVLPDGRFPRDRSGEMGNWNHTIRQALYLIGDQMNRRPDSVWGKKFLERKVYLQQKHPDVILVEGLDDDGKKGLIKMYTKGHIHKMTRWSALNKFARRLWKDWWKLEGGAPAKPKPTPTPVSETASEPTPELVPEPMTV